MRLPFNTSINSNPFRLLLSPPLFPTKTPPFQIRCSQPKPKTLTFVLSSMSTLVKVKDKIELSDTEKKIFDRLLNTVRHFGLSTELRVAGGWVRDKLLGKECYDIDIAIDNMLGSEFVDKVKEYLLSTGEEVKGLAVIPRNPDQSKHLETARIRLCDLWIDFVNLRCEDYSDNSRIPTMKFGTAEEDAYRRDLTINSLFYNINTSSVEDLTGRGIEDLKSGKIVTPLPPKSTFLDDPLRVLRAIRFGARFGFELDEELKIAAACEDVKNALAAKISRERIGIEIDLMISGNQPVKAMTYISDLTLFWVVFCIPPEAKQSLPEICHRFCVAYLEAAWRLIQLIGSTSFTDEQRRLSLYAALFLPMRTTTYKDTKNKKTPVVNFIFKDALKQKNSDSETIIKIHKSVEEFIKLTPLLTSREDSQADVDCLMKLGDMLGDVSIKSKLRVLTGFVLREIKEFWRVALLLSMMVHPDDIDNSEELVDKQFEVAKRKELYKAVESYIVELGLDKVWDVKPLANGRDIMNVLELKSGGPLIKEWQDRTVAWQLANPSGTPDECIEWMRQTYSKRPKLSSS